MAGASRKAASRTRGQRWLDHSSRVGVEDVYVDWITRWLPWVDPSGERVITGNEAPVGVRLPRISEVGAELICSLTGRTGQARCLSARSPSVQRLGPGAVARA